MKFVKRSKIGLLGFYFDSDFKLVQIEFESDEKSTSNDVPPPSAQACIDKILTYVEDGQADLSGIDFVRSGTAHQSAVWDYIRNIPKGQTITYSALSEAVGGSPRTVANALRHNPLPILFPCHRVVAKSGIGGFSGDTSGSKIDIKKHLLRIEGANV